MIHASNKRKCGFAVSNASKILCFSETCSTIEIVWKGKHLTYCHYDGHIYIKQYRYPINIHAGTSWLFLLVLIK